MMLPRLRQHILPTCLVVVALLGGGCAKSPATGGAVRQFDAKRAFADLEMQVNMGPRYPGSPGHVKLQDHLREQMHLLADELQVQRFETSTIFAKPKQKFQFMNIIGRFAPNARGKVLALAAHFDTRPVADQDRLSVNRKKPVPGANDGASGVAVLLEIARALKAQPPPFPVELIFLDAEDSGDEALGDPLFGFCLGARYFVAHIGNMAPDYVILLDMVGDQDLRLPRELNSLTAAPKLMEQIYATGKKLGHPAFVPDSGPRLIDDHLPFIQANIPAVDFIDFDYPYWHTTQDLPEHCSPDSLQQVGETLLALIANGIH